MLKTLEQGEELIHIPARKELVNAHIDERIERVSTEHDEMQWRLIRLGRLARCDVWVPKSDKAKQYEGHQFRESVAKPALSDLLLRSSQVRVSRGSNRATPWEERTGDETRSATRMVSHG